jgi:tRNA G46 methylase TrmB
VTSTNLPTSPASERNKQPILDVLVTVLPATGHVLEIASGTGQHVCHFAQRLPALRWQPSDPDAPSCETIAARIAASGLPNIEPPVLLDVQAPEWLVRAS